MKSVLESGTRKRSFFKEFFAVFAHNFMCFTLVQGESVYVDWKCIGVFAEVVHL